MSTPEAIEYMNNRGIIVRRTDAELSDTMHGEMKMAYKMALQQLLEEFRKTAEWRELQTRATQPLSGEQEARLRAVQYAFQVAGAL